MITGTCPYDCGEGFLLAVQGDRLPVPRIAIHRCEGCGKLIYTYVSRLDPKSWAQDAFYEEYPEAGTDEMPLRTPNTN